MVAEEDRVEGADDEWSDDKIDAMLEDQTDTTDKESTSVEEEPEVEAPQPPPFGRGLVAFLVVVSMLGPVIVFGVISLAAAAGPEVFPHADGGVLRVIVSPKCEEWIERACFTSGNVTYLYAFGEEDRYPLWSGADGDLQEAYVTVRVETDRGVWIREYWLPEGQMNSLYISPGMAQGSGDEGVIGREPGVAVFAGAGALFGIVILASTGGWWATGSVRAASLTHRLLGVVMALQVTYILVRALMLLYLPIIPLLILGWIWLLRKGVALWLEGQGSAVGPEPPLEGVPDPAS